jgi:hypothetical protein
MAVASWKSTRFGERGFFLSLTLEGWRRAEGRLVEEREERELDFDDEFEGAGGWR